MFFISSAGKMAHIKARDGNTKLSSAVIFYFGYSQTSKSEQIKIVRDIMDRIGLKFKGLG